MSFTVPTFNLSCNIFDNGNLLVPRLSGVACNLANGRRTALPTVGPDPTQSLDQFAGSMTLLLPIGTDVRDVFNAESFDTVEVPAGTGRFYKVLVVDDIGKGFPNEHRYAQLTKQGNALGFWPTPIP